jgi:hypothetical protein
LRDKKWKEIAMKMEENGNFCFWKKKIKPTGMEENSNTG